MPATQPFDHPSADQLVARLRDLESRAPAEARRFREIVGELIRQSERGGRQLFPWVRKREIQERAEEVVRLEQAVSHVEELFSLADGARKKIQNLRLRLGKVQVASDMSWIEERCVSWEAALSALGATLPRASALARARGVVADTAASVDLHDDALEWLERGHQVLRGLSEHGLEIEGATLEADLPIVAARFRSEGPSRKTVDELASRVQELVDVLARQPQEAPIQYNDAAGVLERVEEWHQALKGLGQLDEQEDRALADLRGRLETARRMWRRQDPEDANAVLAKARGLLERTEEAARSRRAQAVQDLWQQVRYLSQISGPTEAEEELESLRQASDGGPGDHSRWWGELDRTWRGFWAEAENEVEELADRLAQRWREIEGLLGGLAKLPLSEEGRSRLDRVESALRELGRSSEPKDLLRDLQRVDRLWEDAEALRSDAAKASRGLVTRRQVVERRRDRLRKEAERAGVSAETLPAPGSEPTERDVVVSLEESERDVARLEQETEQAERQFVAACAEALGRIAGAIDRSGRALEVVGDRSPRAPSSAAFPPDVTVTRAAEAVVGARRRQSEIESEVDAAWARLNERREALVDRLGQLPVDSLRPGDRDEATALADDLLSGPWDESSRTSERLELLAPVVARGEELFARLSREEDEARERLTALRGRFEALGREELHQACGELYDRVEALVRGVPENPIRWRPVLRQIALAEDLLGRLEIHARRLAVSELGEAVDLLEEQRRRGVDPEAEALLAELAELDPLELPPPSLRRRIRRQARAVGVTVGRRRSHG